MIRMIIKKELPKQFFFIGFTYCYEFLIPRSLMMMIPARSR